MASKIDGKRSREPIARVDVKALAGRVLEGLGQVRGQVPRSVLQSILSAVVDQSELKKELSRHTLQDVASERRSLATTEEAVWFPADFPVILAARFLADQNADAARVTAGGETWFLGRDVLEQEAGRLRSSFVRRSSVALKASLAPVWEGAAEARLGMGKIFDNAVANLMAGLRFYQCNYPGEEHCFPRDKKLEKCEVHQVPLREVDSC